MAWGGSTLGTFPDRNGKPGQYNGNAERDVHGGRFDDGAGDSDLGRHGCRIFYYGEESYGSEDG